MGSLRIIQILARIAKIISTVIFVFCIVGLCMSVFGLISTVAFKDEVVKAANVNIHTSILKDASELSLADIYSVFAITIVCCLSAGIIAGSARRYFANELEAGTPFTLEGAKEMQTLGIITIIANVCMSIAVGSILAARKKANADSVLLKSLGTDTSVSISYGVVFLILSVVFRYGAEISGNSGADPVFKDDSGENRRDDS